MSNEIHAYILGRNYARDGSITAGSEEPGAEAAELLNDAVGALASGWKSSTRGPADAWIEAELPTDRTIGAVYLTGTNLAASERSAWRIRGGPSPHVGPSVIQPNQQIPSGTDWAQLTGGVDAPAVLATSVTLPSAGSSVVIGFGPSAPTYNGGPDLQRVRVRANASAPGCVLAVEAYAAGTPATRASVTSAVLAVDPPTTLMSETTVIELTFDGPALSIPAGASTLVEIRAEALGYGGSIDVYAVELVADDQTETAVYDSGWMRAAHDAPATVREVELYRTVGHVLRDPGGYHEEAYHKYWRIDIRNDGAVEEHVTAGALVIGSGADLGVIADYKLSESTTAVARWERDRSYRDTVGYPLGSLEVTSGPIPRRLIGGALREILFAASRPGLPIGLSLYGVNAPSWGTEDEARLSLYGVAEIGELVATLVGSWACDQENITVKVRESV